MQSEFEAVFAGLPPAKGSMKFGVEIEPVLHGFWGDDYVHTISHQSVLLVRCEFMTNGLLFVLSLMHRFCCVGCACVSARNSVYHARAPEYGR
jgi:hypothetical protein